jgi:hypothetical protein
MMATALAIIVLIALPILFVAGAVVGGKAVAIPFFVAIILMAIGAGARG